MPSSRARRAREEDEDDTGGGRPKRRRRHDGQLRLTAYALRAAECDCAPLFSSLDAPTCFDYGISAGHNWEFPRANGSLLARSKDDMLFQC